MKFRTLSFTLLSIVSLSSMSAFSASAQTPPAMPAQAAPAPSPAQTAPAQVPAHPIPSMPPPPPGSNSSLPTFTPTGPTVAPIDVNTPGIEATLPTKIDIPGNAALVNGKPLTYQTLITKFIAAGAPQFLDEMINEQLIRQQAKKEGVSVSPAEVDEKLLEAKKFLLPQYPGQSWAQFLFTQGRSESYIRDNIYDGLLAVKLVEKTMPAPSLLGKIHLYHILKLTVQVPGGPAPVSDTTAQQEIADIRALIVSGKATFQDEAKKESQDSSASKGGDLGWVGKEARLDPAFAAAAFALKEGEVSQPVKSQYGWHLILNSEIGAHATPPEIATFVADYRSTEDKTARQQIPTYLKQLRASAKVVNYVLPTPAGPKVAKMTSFSVPRPATRKVVPKVVKPAGK